MSETLRLLKHDPAVALLIMVNNHFNIHLRSEFTDVKNPQVLDGAEGLTSVEISTKDSTDDGIFRQHTGSMTYRYRRLSVAEVFSGIALDLTPPLTVWSVLNNISLASGAVFTEDDFENGLITTRGFELKAKPSSLRWVGQTTVMLNEPGTSIQLADAFSNNILDGLNPPVY